MGNVRDDEKVTDAQADIAMMRLSGYLRRVMEAESEIAALVAKAKAEIGDMSGPQYRFSCLQVADGDIGKAREMFSFVMGEGAK